VVLVKDGRIEALGPRDELAIPAGYAVRDLGDLWVMPGMIDLHSHAGGTIADINDTVYLTQPEFRVSATVIPHGRGLHDALSGGVTSVLFIPGSGVNSGGQGVLLKTGLDRYEDARIRDPGSLKVAQFGNPEQWAIGIGKTVESYNLRQMFTQGLAYAKQWHAFEHDNGPKPEKNPRFDVFRELYEKRTQVSTHTQIYQVVLQTITMIRGEFGIDCYIDHGEWDGAKAAALAQEKGVPAILGPRAIDYNNPGFVGLGFQLHNDGRIEGIPAKYQAAGHKQIGFNTDSLTGLRGFTPAPEELSLVACVAVRYGFDDSNLDAVRGLTIVPAKTAGIDKRVGSLEAGKDADIVALDGHPADPRCAVRLIYIEGQQVYDANERARKF
jgi:dihydroorotase-like cyclic amidohydrolase